MRLAAIEDHREAARRVLPRFAYGYLEGGAEGGDTLARNVDAFRFLDFEPETLVDVSQIDTSVQLFGRRLAMPVAVGPTGLNGLFRHRADELLAAASARAGVPFVLSTASTSSIEAVKAACQGELWLQLYVQNDRRIAENLMREAMGHGFSVLLLTVDTPVAGLRDHYVRDGFTLPVRWTPRLVLDVLKHPRWCMSTGVHGIPQMVNLARCAGGKTDISLQAAAMNQQMSKSLAWSDLKWIRQHWDGPLLVKGVCTLADARRAQQYGADGVVLSNHGGRQLAHVPSALEVLPKVADLLGGRIQVLMDGGVRRGSDIAKAMALGAGAVLLGRAPLYGVASGGAQGVDDVLRILRNELEVTLRLLGRPKVCDLDRGALSEDWQLQLDAIKMLARDGGRPLHGGRSRASTTG